MNPQRKTFGALVREAEEHPFSGWDFSWLEGRYETGKPRWNYNRIVKRRMKGASSMLDLGTGGGELLSSLRPFPKTAFATESYPPNISVAKKRLGPLGVEVVGIASDDSDLPFADGFFDLVIDRHESFRADELRRILRPGGLFVTQQVGEKHGAEINQCLGVAKPALWTLRKGVSDLEGAGFEVLDSREELAKGAFFDVGALVYFLKAVPWEVPDFSVSKYGPQLRKIHRTIREQGRFSVTDHYCLIEARRR